LRRQSCSGNSLGVCKDGAAQINGFHSGLVAQSRRIAHHELTRECFASKDVAPQIYEVLSQSVKNVNFVKASASNL
jgi:hypothetical protein